MSTFTYAHPKLDVTVDAVVFGLTPEGSLSVLLIERGEPPFAGAWALPGGFVRLEETLDEAVRRELEEETGLRDVFLEQLYTFGDIDRDPRHRTISVSYYALVREQGPRAGSDARNARWWPIAEIPRRLAFDHRTILETALARLRGKVTYAPIGFNLLPLHFTLSDLQRLYEQILGQPLDKRNFRRRISELRLLVEVDGFARSRKTGPKAKLYAFDAARYAELARAGFSLSLDFEPRKSADAKGDS